MELEGHVALVTGASRGVGAAIAKLLSEAGADVAVVYGSDEKAASEVVARIERDGRKAVAVGADLRDPAALEEMSRAVEDSLGPVDVLVSNAGIAPMQSLEEISDSDWDRVMEVNLRPAFLLARRIAPGMRERGWGRLVFVSSVAAFTGGVIGPQYAASKSGLHGLVAFLSSRLAPNGVTANVLAPALIEDTAMLPGDPGDLASRIPVGRLGRPEEVADLALAVLRNGYLTGQVIGIDGGLHPR